MKLICDSISKIASLDNRYPQTAFRRIVVMKRFGKTFQCNERFFLKLYFLSLYTSTYTLYTYTCTNLVPWILQFIPQKVREDLIFFLFYSLNIHLDWLRMKDRSSHQNVILISYFSHRKLGRDNEKNVLNVSIFFFMFWLREPILLLIVSHPQRSVSPVPCKVVVFLVPEEKGFFVCCFCEEKEMCFGKD